MKVLVVEDEVIIALDLISRISNYGFESVGIAGDMDEALNLMNEDVCLVFMDINLKGDVDGIQIAQKLREKFDFYLVFISASKDKKHEIEAIAFDKCEFINKPFNYERIHSVFQNALSYTSSN